MRLLATLVLGTMIVSGCMRDARGEACDEVYGPLFDPAGSRHEVAAHEFELPRGAIEAGCYVFEDADAYADARERGAAGTGDSPRIDFATQRVVALRGPAGGAEECLQLLLGDAFGLSTGMTVIETHLRPSSGEGICVAEATVWGVVVPKDGSRVLHAHDERR